LLKETSAMKLCSETAVSTLCFVGLSVLLCRAQTFTTLTNFTGANGDSPQGTLVQGTDGNFYGTTAGGGVNGTGTVFKVTPGGALTTLYSFGPIGVDYENTDGIWPIGTLTRGTDANFYGTTKTGGSNEGCGTIFKVTSAGALTTLYNFASSATDGCTPEAGVIQGTDGNFYGTTNTGTTGPTIFKITPAGVLTTLYTFTNESAGSTGITTGLVQGSDGNLYGTTSTSLFRITTAGVFTMLSTGGFLDSTLVEGSDGNIYGVGDGFFFKVTPAGALTTLANFGQFASVLVRGNDGNFYGASSPSLFKITPSGSLTTLYTLGSSPTDGEDGVYGLVQGTDGNFYGTTEQGGTRGDGTFFRLQLSGTAPYTCTNSIPPIITSVDSASAYGAFPYFSSGSWLEIKGTNLADPADPRLTAATNPGQWTSADFNGSNAPTSLDGISATVNGKPAYIYYLSTGQLNVQAPEDTTTGNVAITVTNCNATSSPVMFQRRALAPGFLAPTNYTANGTQYMVATYQSDGAYVLNTATGAAFGLNSRPAKPGDGIIAYGIGFGDVTPSILPGVIAGASNSLVNPVTISFGTTKASVAYAGLAGGFVGLYEFYFTVPATLTSGDYQIEVTQNGSTVPQTLYLTVQSAIVTPTAQLKTLTLSATSVVSGGTVQGTVTLSAAAPTGGAVVALGSNSGTATVPASVTIPGGATSATFAITAGTVTSNQTATITASYGGVSAQASLLITGSVGPMLPPYTQISFTATFSTATETSTNNVADIVIVNNGPASVGLTFNGPQIYNISGQFQIATNGQTLTLQPTASDAIQFGPSFANYNITAGSIILNLSPQGMTVSGTVTGTFSLTTSFATVTGTITGTYSGS
jgi:uncharacterized protein (TIGR03437 family)